MTNRETAGAFYNPGRTLYTLDAVKQPNDFLLQLNPTV